MTQFLGIALALCLVAASPSFAGDESDTTYQPSWETSTDSGDYDSEPLPAQPAPEDTATDDSQTWDAGTDDSGY